MNYSLRNLDTQESKKQDTLSLIRQFKSYLSDKTSRLLLSLASVILNSSANIIAPLILGTTIDKYIFQKDLAGITYNSIILISLYLLIFITGFFQTRTMGTIGQDILFALRRDVFDKIQSLPLAFFNQNKIGDLISRINNDTDKLNQFFSQSLVQFVGNIFTILGVGIFIFFINFEFALITISSALVLFVITYFLSPWINKQNRQNLQSLGNLSAEIQESLSNFKVIVAFNRRDYFRDSFTQANEANFKSSVRSGIANNITAPIYDLSGNVASLLVLFFGIKLVMEHQLTIGILVAFLSYADRFYSPLRQMAAIWSNAQLSLAAWGRIVEILILHTDHTILPKDHKVAMSHLLQFKSVSFGYSSKKILNDVNFSLDKGKTYAIVGPTGGGKSTTASLMTRLYDPDEGQILFEGRDIRSIPFSELSQKIGFILQDQYLFSGTVGENIAYGNPKYSSYSESNLLLELKELDLDFLIEKFEGGLATQITPSTELISLGQKQIISFLRAIIRRPSLLIMDEATANIDTITESLLQEIIDKLPPETTKVIIAHRFNTIKKADEIFFVNGGQVISAASYEKSLQLIKEAKRTS